MAVKATFTADFSSFQDAVNRAQVSLRTFETQSDKVGDTLSKMVDRFSGRKILEEGAQLNRLFTDTNSIALLTQKELQQVGAKAAEALEKMQRLGIEAPANLRNLADAARDANVAGGGFTEWIGKANNVLGLFGVGLSVGALVSFGRSLLDDADALTKMHDKTGITVEGLQRFQVAGDDAGNTLDEITSAVVQMENRLAGGDKSATSALKQLGLSLVDLKGQSPERQFIEISDALRQIQDPAKQVNIAMDIFGKTGASVLPTLKRGFDDLRDSAVGMSADTVQALDNVGDSLEKASRQFKGDAANALNFLFLGFSEADRAAERFGKQIDAVKPPVDLTSKALKDLSLNEFEAKRVGDELTKSANEMADALTELQSVGDGWRGTLETIDGTVVESIKFYLEAGVSQKALATSYDLTAAQIRSVASALKEENDMMTLVRGIEKTALQQSLKEYDNWAANASKAADRVAESIIKGAAQIQEIEKKRADETAKLTLSTTDYQILKIREWEEATIAAFKGSGEQLVRYTALIQSETAKQMNALTPIVTLIGGNATNLREDTQDRIHQGPAGGGAFQLPGFHLPTFSLSGTRAGGGPVSAGQTYRVGERGTELFTPNTSGSIIPNAGGGPIVVQLVVDGRVLAEVVNAQNTRTMRQGRMLPSA